MADHEAQAVLQAMSNGVAQEIMLLKETASGLLKLLTKLVSGDRDGELKREDSPLSLPEILKKTEDIEGALRNIPCVTVPYVNRIAFEKEMAEAGMRFIRNSDLDMGEIEQQVYIIDSKDKIAAFELVKKYSYLQPRHIVTNEEQEKEYFQGCPITDVSGFDMLSADRTLRLLDEKGVLAGVSFDQPSGEYTLRVPRDKEKMLLEAIIQIEVCRGERDSKWIETAAAYRNLMNNHIKNAGDFTPDNPCVIFDAEKPCHILIVSKEGFEERYITRNENNEIEEQFVYRNSLNNAITKKCYEELLNSNSAEERQKAGDFKPCYEKLTENREEFDKKLASIADRMGTAAFIDIKTFEHLTEEQKLIPGLITQHSLEAELILAQEGDRLKAYTVTRDERGAITIELNASIERGETDINRDRLDRAVKSTESEKILDTEEIESNRQDKQIRIETNFTIRSTGFAAGEQRRDGHTQTIELDSRGRTLDYRDINDNGSIPDELQNAEQKGLPINLFDISDEKSFEARDDSSREEKDFFNED